MVKTLMSINDLDSQAIEHIFGLAFKIKKHPEKFSRALEGKMFGLLFEKPSMRTWVSFEAGIVSMSGTAIYLGPESIKLGVREEVRDVARVLDRYLSGVILRTFAHKTITEFKRHFKKPVINGLSNSEHPCQALSDYMTIYEKFPEKKKLKVVFIGDGNNVLNSLILTAAKLGKDLYYATPKGHEPNKRIVEIAKKIAKKSGAKIKGMSNPKEAAKNADVIYTDVWVSMGEESIREEKLKVFKGMQVNKSLIKKAKKDVIVMHCLPAHRGEEITDDVIEGKHSVVFDQAENRLYVQKAILLYLCDHEVNE